MAGSKARRRVSLSIPTPGTRDARSRNPHKTTTIPNAARTVRAGCKWRSGISIITPDLAEGRSSCIPLKISRERKGAQVVLEERDHEWDSEKRQYKKRERDHQGPKHIPAGLFSRGYHGIKLALKLYKLHLYFAELLGHVGSISPPCGIPPEAVTSTLPRVESPHTAPRPQKASSPW